MVIICVFVVLLWAMPIYAMEPCNKTSNLSSNGTDQVNHDVKNLDWDQDLDDQILALKTAAPGEYKDIQDLRLKILQIIEQMRLLRQKSGTAYSSEIIDLRNQITDLRSQMRNLIKE